MKVLQITISSKGGAGIAARRLHNALLENGVKSAFLSGNLTLNFENEMVEDAFFSYKRPNLIQKTVFKLKTVLFPNVAQKWSSQLEKVKKELHYEVISLPFSHFKLHEHPLVKEADIINLHWVGDFIDYPSFFKHCQKPIVWTLHDMNPFQGIYHYKNDEIENEKYSKVIDDCIKTIKLQQTNLIHSGTIVTPSKWLLGEVTRSSFFEKLPKTAIVNSIDLNVFKIQDKTSVRKEYGIGQDEFVLLFVADSIKNKRKGFHLLIEALKIIQALKITVIAVGKGDLPIFNNIKIISCGNISSPEEMAKLYALADVFVLPSIEDNLPNVMLESFACGTPMIGFPIGGVSEHVVSGHTGLLASKVDSIALAEVIIKFSETKKSFNNERIRKYAEGHFNFKSQAQKYIEIYNNLK